MITHIMKDGRVLKDIRGHKVKKEDCPMVYQIIGKSRKKKGKKRDD
jgi:hypothetical protein